MQRAANLGAVVRSLSFPIRWYQLWSAAKDEVVSCVAWWVLDGLIEGYGDYDLGRR